jgi:hypothetical protein
MKNKSYYFSHDGNAHNDVKLQFLIDELGMEGYGIFWYLIESLFEAGGYLPIKIIPILARQMNTTQPKVEVIINNYGLFDFMEESFCNRRLLHHFQIKNILVESGKSGAAKRWEAKNRGAISLPKDTPLAIKEKKEKKEKKLKYLHSDLGDLPEIKVQASIELVSALRKLTLTFDQVQSLWSAWKKSHLDGETEYQTENKVYQHFLNSLKYQKFDEHQSGIAKSSTKNRNPGLYSLLDELRQEYTGDNQEPQGGSASL